MFVAITEEKSLWELNLKLRLRLAEITPLGDQDFSVNHFGAAYCLKYHFGFDRFLGYLR